MKRLNGNLVRVAAVLAVGFGIIGSVIPAGLAAEGRLSALNYNDGHLLIEAKGHVSRPQVEIQPGDSGESTTAFLVLTFPHASADIATLQKIGNGILSTHPELQRFLVSATASAENAPQEGVEICLEFKLSSQMPTLTSNVVSAPSGGWLITAQPARNAETADVNMGVSSGNAVGQTLTAGNHRQQAPLSAAMPAGTTAIQVAQTSLEHQGRKAEKHQKYPISMDAVALNEGLKDVTADLQRVMNERDALESQVIHLKQQLAERDHPSDWSNSAGDYIRPPSILGDDPKVRETVTIQNLQLALSRVSTRLKATQVALAAQTDKTRQLASQVAYLTHDPALLQEPSLVIRPEEPSETVAVAESPSPQTMLAVAPLTEGLPESAPDRISMSNWRDESFSAISSLQTVPVSHVYKAPAENAAAATASFKPRETQLKAALKARPNDAKAALKLADLYASVHQLSHAEQVLLQFLTVQPDYKPGYYALALVYVGERKNVQAQSALDTYRRLNPADKVAIGRLQESIWSITKLSQTTVKP